ncbi:hypothetical protein SASPL_125273 [Salvia splendens]|uniref:Uncharacterized protein n=1 Tax=Salvia splendens TaxID=180675 RepID=A0A8X8XDH4_SALSN|nr:hypothetical protein SASPL_125273 [Salvia splendens]
MDVCFLKDGATASEDPRYLAIGCSDNYVYFWDISRYNMYSEVKYAAVQRGVVVWKVICQNGAKQPGSHAEDHLQLNSDEGFSYPGHKDALISRLVGHAGSIFRIVWFSNGTKLVSVSDDHRWFSARIWKVQAEKGISCSAAQEQVNQIEGPVLFGHNARIWDCCIFESVIITAGEDCTYRVWDHHGRELKEIKEHIGRGVWRCLYDPGSSLLVTAGFDSAIKLHQLCISNEGIEKTVASEDFSDRKEAFALSIPKSSSYGGLMDSKSEYVRCLNFSREDSLYVATNNGYLYHVNLCNTEAAKWTELARISEEAPTICMDLLSKCSDTPDRCEDWIAVGDGKGGMTIARVVGTGWKVEVEFTFTWTAEEERHLLGTYWCKLPEARFIFTADPSGRLKLWKLCHNSHSASLIDKGSYDVCLIAEYASCFGKRIMCLDASFDDELIVCGDIHGAHGVSSVNSVSISRLLSDEVDIRSTGADGCVCHFQYERDLQSMEFIGMKQVKELGAVRSVFTTDGCDDSVVSEYAVGFASDNFIIWNLTSGTKVQQITCGGWRRLHSYYLGHLPEMMNCFAFVKDDVIYIHRHWVPENNRKIYPQNLHLQFHGREIHSLCFIHEQSLCSQDENRGLAAKSSWLATGCEDGTVRLTRYELGMENWSSSQHLGEHVGGSAVRSICAVSKMHVFMPDPSNIRNVVYRQTGIVNGRDPFILISVGAKRVVTAWKQTVTTIKNRVDAISSEMNKNNENNSSDSSAATMSSLSFQGLSTDMPLRHNSNMKRQDSNNVSETPEDGIVTASNAIPCESVSPECRNTEPNLYPVDNFDNDWRYLDVTAFIVREAGSRFSVCFVIVACSDATVTLRALVLPFRLWFDVASLAPLSSPVLSLEHVVTPRLLSKGLQMENCLDFQKRPRTGRGSQGGRWWRSIDTKKPKKRPVNCKLREKGSNLSVSGGRTESSKEKEDHLHGTSETSMFKQSDDHVPLKVIVCPSIQKSLSDCSCWKGNADDRIPSNKLGGYRNVGCFVWGGVDHYPHCHRICYFWNGCMLNPA